MSLTTLAQPQGLPAPTEPEAPRSKTQAPLNKPRPKPLLDRLLLAVPLTIALIFTLVPFYWMLLFAFRPAGSTSLVPWPITFDHFIKVWNGNGFGVFFLNSLYVAGVSLIISTVIGLLGGYALARFAFRGKSAFVLIMLCTQFIPGAMLLIPLFQVFNGLGLTNSLWALIISDTVFQLPLSLVLMAGFIRNVPIDLEEQAWVDGCSRFRAFITVVLPLLKPGIVAVGSFAFISAWNNFLFAIMFITSQDQFTIPVGLSYLLGEFGTDFGALAAGGVVAVVPVVAVFAYVQKYLVQGLSAGAVKG
ncbi:MULTISPECIES: carbohydrate ABC transporter permease [unclassified Pseudoclavibacter]|uniref:carbohydrate ABC transporter permease n=1 Tax=unclassified Pseudoclavibacter TaxID=2615177 RepID=UPI0012F2B4C0|nr:MULTISPECIES: carbohydrate ABC transporter permease [unclassified Pseudoclavibacter]MBF4458743.1 carbohydrate ABC transporter permease [Pseudoclavibacter sp. VKM Ac-2867]VXB08427.1 Transporter [Pseudoclavibacter sp. 8L]